MAGLAEFEWDLIRDRVKSGPCGGQAARVQCRKRQAREMYPSTRCCELLAYPTGYQVASEEAQHHRYGNVGRWRCQQKDCPDYDPRPPFVVSRHGFCSSQGVSGEHTPELVTKSLTAVSYQH